jgi:hypothetical protein
MNCELVQRRLLNLEDASHVPPDVRAHLASCGSCRDWRSHLVQLERHVPLLPVPVSRGKKRLLRRLLHSAENERRETAPALSTLASVLPALPASPDPAPARTSVTVPALASGLAAALVLAVVGWWLWSGRVDAPATSTPNEKPAVDPLLASLLQRDLRLAQANTPRERIEILADVADDLRGETRTLAQASALRELTALATLYHRVVNDGIVQQAKVLPPSQRRAVLNHIADRLARTATMIEQLAQRTETEYARPLRTIAETARKGNRQLSALLPEDRL